MNVSLISTVKNEVSNVDKLIKSILTQTLFPNEIVIVDAGSTETKSLLLMLAALLEH